MHLHHIIWYTNVAICTIMEFCWARRRHFCCLEWTQEGTLEVKKHILISVFMLMNKLIFPSSPRFPYNNSIDTWTYPGSNHCERVRFHKHIALYSQLYCQYNDHIRQIISVELYPLTCSYSRGFLANSARFSSSVQAVSTCHPLCYCTLLSLFLQMDSFARSYWSSSS